MRTFSCIGLLFLFILSFPVFLKAQNVIIVTIDGARYSETFGSGSTNIPHLYNDMKPLGTLYSNFRINYPSGYTETCPGHSAIETGSWQPIANDGTVRPTRPTIFEYLRRQNGNPQSDCYVVTGKSKLNILDYSTYSGYGSSYRGTWVGDDNKNDAQTYSKAISVMQNYRPKLLVISFSQVDDAGHAGNWNNYLSAINNADSYVYQIWQHIQSGDYGYNTSNTTMFVTNDHGRHDDAHGGFTDHGDGCEGCSHIMLLALGRNVNTNRVSSSTAWQIDIAPTVGSLLGFQTPLASGTSLLGGSQRSVSLTSPNGGEDWIVGNSRNITWSSTNVSNVKIEYSTNNGSSWTNVISSRSASSGNYSWTIPNTPSSNCRVRISDVSSSSISDQSNSAFSISSPIIPEIMVTSPNGGEDWEVGSSHNITWSSSYVANVKIDYSTNNGSSWINIVSSTSSSTGTYSWTIPNTPSTNCRVMISDVSNSSTTDQNNSAFSISPPIIPEIMVASPNGGEDWEVDSSYNITWTSSYVTNVKIDYSSDNGNNWINIVPSASASAGSYSWTIPNTPSSNCLVMISDVSNSLTTDQNDSVFSISPPIIPEIMVASPNGGEDWEVDSSYNITWTSSYVTNVKIDYSSDNGNNWINISPSTSASAGSYSWTIPNTPSANCLVMISDVSNSSVNDQSDSIFSISLPIIPEIMVTSPNGGEDWEVGSSHNISWSSSYVTNVKIDYSSDNGNNWINITPSASASEGSYSWTIPNTPSTNCLVMISDVSNSLVNDQSDSVFSISPPIIPEIMVTSPNGGEDWEVGSSHNISWSSSYVTNVKIDYSSDNGNNWINIVSSTSSSTGSYNWTIPNTPSSNCLVMISDVSNSLVNDQSDSVFSISLPIIPEIQVITPNGGEVWKVGSTNTVTWNSSYIDDVKIGYSTNAGTDWTNIILSIPATVGSYEWTIPNTPSNQSRIRISDVIDSLIYSESSTNFIIKLPGTIPIFPINNSTGVSLSPILTWTEIQEADKYRLEINTSADFNGTVVYNVDTLNITSKQIGGLFDNTTYYWRVTVLNNNGNSSNASSIFKFTTGQTVLVGATNGATFVSTSPTLIWNKTPGANNYRLEVNTNSDFSGTVLIDNTSVADTTQALSGLSYNTTYYWRVTASSNSLAKTTTSDVYSFTTKLAATTPISPTNNSTGISLMPTLSWTPVLGADKYRLQVNTNPDFNGVIIYEQDTVSIPSTQISGLFDNTIYYWRVTAFNNSGNSSEVSSTFTFTTRTTAGIEPLNGSKVVSTSPTLIWNKIVSANNYRLEVNTNSDFGGTVIFDSSSIADTTQALSGLAYNTTYYWRVTASSNSLAKTTTSDVYNFTTKLATVALTFPANNSTGISLSPILNWSVVSGADRYRLEVNTKNDFSGAVIYDEYTVSVTTKQIDGLFDNVTYYWRVTAVNNSGNSSEVSSVFAFTTDQSVLVSAGNGATSISTSPILVWNKTTGATSYRLEININPDFSGMVIFDNASITDTLQSLTALNYNTTYYWRITAYSNSLAKTITSDVYSFTTKLAKANLISPVNNSTDVTLSPVLEWTSVPGSDRYQLEVNTSIDFNGTEIYNQDTVSLPLKQITGLFDDTSYYWRVTAFNNSGNSSDTSNTFAFTTTAATNIEPLNGATFVSTSPTLIWNKISGANSYRLEVNTKSDFSGLSISDSSSVIDTLSALSGLSNNTTYFWRVTAYSNNLSKITSSDTYNFTTKLTNVNLLSPVNNSTDILLSPILSWMTVDGADRYWLEVNTKADFTGTVVYDQDTLNLPLHQMGVLSANTNYYWRVTALNDRKNSSDASIVFGFITTNLTDIATLKNIIPQEYKLFQNYPNPFNPTTTIRYALPVESKLTISVYDVLGQEVNTLHNSTRSAGFYEITFNASNLASGIYFLRITAISTYSKKTFADTKKLILMK